MSGRRLVKCCPNCFSDRHLRSQTIPKLSEEVGKCSFCESVDVPLVSPPLLADQFAPLINIYVEEEGGKLLVQWLKEDWGMFVHPRIDEARAMQLLSEVLDNGEIVRKLFVPSPRYSSDGLFRWEALRKELMETNRYFPDADLDKKRLSELLPQLLADDLPKVWYRARLQQDEKPYTIEEMGSPPARITSHGRANPPGIPYLYLGSAEQTAVSEVRPHTGETASVADFTLAEGLQMIDLRDARERLSPFVYGDEDDIGALRTDVPFLARLGEELTRPVLPQGAAIEYVPSQYLCEYIKKQGYDGVVYSSSVSEGINLALFDPKKAVPGVVKQLKVTRVTVTVE